MPVRLLGLPHDSNSSFMRGPALAPANVREAFGCDSANRFCETGHDLGVPDNLIDAGDTAVEQLRGREAFEAIRAAVQGELGDGQRVLSIGGDHSVSYPAISAHAEAFEGLCVLHFDAHPDLYDDFEGNRFSHASPFARLMEEGRIDRLVQVGLRTINAHQREQADRFGVEQHEMRDLSALRDIAFDGAFYVSIDLDALDPAFAPGVSHHEPGGLTTRQVIDLVHTVPGTLVGGDVVELNPRRDVNGVTAMVAAKLAKELAGRMLDDLERN